VTPNGQASVTRARIGAWALVGGLMGLALVVNSIALILTLRRLLTIVHETQHDLTR